MGPLTAPEPLGPQQDVSQFSSGVPALDAWLQGKARLNEAKGGARTYVACDADRIAGFYSLAASSVERWRVSSRVGRGMPDPVPVILLSQLAVDTNYQDRHLGSDLLIGAARRALAAADLIGARAIVVTGYRRTGQGVLRTLRLPAVFGPRAAHAAFADIRAESPSTGLSFAAPHPSTGRRSADVGAAPAALPACRPLTPGATGRAAVAPRPTDRRDR